MILLGANNEFVCLFAVWGSNLDTQGSVLRDNPQAMFRFENQTWISHRQGQRIPDALLLQLSEGYFGKKASSLSSGVNLSLHLALGHGEKSSSLTLSQEDSRVSQGRRMQVEFLRAASARPQNRPDFAGSRTCSPSLCS